MLKTQAHNECDLEVHPQNDLEVVAALMVGKENEVYRGPPNTYLRTLLTKNNQLKLIECNFSCTSCVYLLNLYVFLSFVFENVYLIFSCYFYFDNFVFQFIIIHLNLNNNNNNPYDYYVVRTLNTCFILLVHLS